jgi:hypothetical protein
MKREKKGNQKHSRQIFYSFVTEKDKSSSCAEFKGVIVKEASLSKSVCNSLCFSSTFVYSMHSFRSREKNM